MAKAQGSCFISRAACVSCEMSFASLRPHNGQEESAVFQSSHVMTKGTVQRKKMPGRQIEHFVLYMHLDMAGESLHGDSSRRSVLLEQGAGLQYGQHDPAVFVLYQRLGISTTLVVRQIVAPPSQEFLST
jgi:hypothetical protein